ncbi:unnamed protein product [Linum trigynum]|uniref:Helitron helicase-like domain-containing protein n=1 Tax=Linum trigynum TaxID=586398 RepID=A0AAV2FXR5_9ROSI
MKLFDMTNDLVKSFRRICLKLMDPASLNLRLRIVGTRDTASRRYELPTGSELAGLILGDFLTNKEERNIIINHRSLKRKHVTQREDYAFRLQHRDDEGQTLMRGGKALQHYVVDAYSTIEQNRLYYLRSHQEDLRSELYYGLTDAFNRGDVTGDDVVHVVLPSSHTGSPRYMKQLYLDKMAVVHHHGSPDLFITFTSELKPDIVARVFRMKLNSLEDELTQGHFFGQTVADGLRFLIINEDGVPSNYTRNIVYQEAFADLQNPSS